jgi:outer membrane protein assembly factor BamE (lipoprotein component of BamABCDE complex)
VKPSSLFAGLVLAAAAMTASADYVITSAQASRIATGMTMQEVRDLLGKPKSDRKFGTGLVTWTYDLRPTDEYIVFDVEFDSAEHVKRVEKRIEGGY